MSASPELSAQKQWWLTLSSPQMSFQTDVRGYLNPTSLHPGLAEPNTLEEDWGINDRLSLHQQISQLVNDGSHGHFLNHAYAQFGCLGSLRWQQRIATEESLPYRTELSFVMATHELVGNGGTRAYDYGRASYLIREGLRMGWVSEEEFDFLHSFIGFRAKYFYRSWRQYTQAWFAGRSIWMFSINQPDTERTCDALLNGWIALRQQRDIHNALTDKTNPIHTVDWDLPLPELSAPQSLLDLLHSTQE